MSQQNADLVPKVITDVNGIQRTVYVKASASDEKHKAVISVDPSSSSIMPHADTLAPIFVEEEATAIYEDLSERANISNLEFFTKPDNAEEHRARAYAGCNFTYSDDFDDEYRMSLLVTASTKQSVNTEITLEAQSLVRVDSFAAQERHSLGSVKNTDEAMRLFSDYAFDDQRQADAEIIATHRVNRARQSAYFSGNPGAAIPLARLEDNKVLGAYISSKDADLNKGVDYYGKIFLRDEESGEEVALSQNSDAFTATDVDFATSADKAAMFDARERFKRECSKDTFYSDGIYYGPEILDKAYDIGSAIRESQS